MHVQVCFLAWAEITCAPTLQPGQLNFSAQLMKHGWKFQSRLVFIPWKKLSLFVKNDLLWNVSLAQLSWNFKTGEKFTLRRTPLFIILLLRQYDLYSVVTLNQYWSALRIFEFWSCICKCSESHWYENSLLQQIQQDTWENFHLLPKISCKEREILYTAVSKKVVLQTGKSLRDNVESYYG